MSFHSRGSAMMTAIDMSRLAASMRHRRSGGALFSLATNNEHAHVTSAESLSLDDSAGVWLARRLEMGWR